MSCTLVLVRHGQSIWNLENRFTGWIDVPLSERGMQEARDAGTLLSGAGYTFDVALTSCLERATHTLELLLAEMDCGDVPIIPDWRLNERHYGALQGLDKRETAEKHGAQQVLEWRRGFSVRPPELADDHPTHPRNDSRYSGVPNLPSAESLADTLVRVRAWWQEALVPSLRTDQCVLVVAHGNSLRALVKLLEHLSEEEILKFNIPTGIPMLYRLDEHFTVLSRRFLADDEKLKAAVDEVRNQASTKQGNHSG
jgi:2,3-bisphosphoglycerate-dependent phosphoglycerate mutase